MRRNIWQIVLAIGLIAFGLAALADSLGFVEINWLIQPGVFWFALFGLGGLIFLAAFLGNPKDTWWAIIPALTLIGLAFLAGNIFLRSIAQYGAVIFLGLIALSFWIIYFVRREHWWAIIPGGVITSVAALILTGMILPATGSLSVAVFFLGMSATFLALCLLPSPIKGNSWPLIPAGILGLMGLAFLFTVGSFGLPLLALVLIAAGGVIIWRSLRRTA